MRPGPGNAFENLCGQMVRRGSLAGERRRRGFPLSRESAALATSCACRDGGELSFLGKIIVEGRCKSGFPGAGCSADAARGGIKFDGFCRFSSWACRKKRKEIKAVDGNGGLTRGPDRRCILCAEITEHFQRLPKITKNYMQRRCSAAFTQCPAGAGARDGPSRGRIRRAPRRDRRRADSRKCRRSWRCSNAPSAPECAWR